MSVRELELPLELYADNELLGSANAADVSDAVYGGAFRFQRGQKLIVRRANNDGYLPGNPLKGRTSFSVVLVQGVVAVRYALCAAEGKE